MNRHGGVSPMSARKTHGPAGAPWSRVCATVVPSLLLCLLFRFWQLDTAMGSAAPTAATPPVSDQSSGSSQSSVDTAIAYPFQILSPGSTLPSDGPCTVVMEQHRNPAFE